MEQPEYKNVDAILQQHATNEDNAAFLKRKPRVFKAAIFLSVALLFLFYFLQSESRVLSVSIEGNTYYSDAYIQSIAKVNRNDIYLFKIPWLVQRRLESSSFIQSATVSWETEGVISIRVEENIPLGYRYDGDEPMLLLEDDSEEPLTSEMMDTLSKVPFITGFDETQQTHLLLSNLASLDEEVRMSIAEISQYSLSYDDETLEILMKDGRYVFSSYYSLSQLNNYFEIRPSISNDSACLYAMDEGDVMVSKACPWNEVPVELDYWKTDDGDFIYNKWGDKAVKHYYTDSNGLEYLDDNGNPILIPINTLTGEEESDASFLEHYELGYYATGTLVIPEENTDETGTAEAE